MILSQAPQLKKYIGLIWRPLTAENNLIWINDLILSESDGWMDGVTGRERERRGVGCPIIFHQLNNVHVLKLFK